MAALDYSTPKLERADFDAARLELIRKRIVVMVYVVATLMILLSLLTELMLHGARHPAKISALSPAFGGVVMILGATFKLRRRRQTLSLQKLMLRSTLFVVLPVIMLLPASELTAQAVSQMMRQAGFVHVHIGALAPLLIALLLIHFSASLIIPWSFWESARPVLIIVGIAALVAPFAPDSWPALLGGLLALFVMGLPGMLVSWFRFSRLRQRVEFGFMRRRYSEVQHELAYARRIHEKLFPHSIRTGAVRFDFRYEPMRQIGGDFVDAIFDDGGTLTIVLVDVTGHGIAAALAVNRLHGEIKRTLATSASASPAEIVASLNEYVHLTLADESVFATAIALRVDPRKRNVTWCSAGHPPAFLCRAASDRIELLEPTEMLLGPLPPEEFEPAQSTLDLRDGDVLFAYTDGAIEARNASEKQLGIEGLRPVVASTSGRAPADMLDAVMSHIAAFRSGPADDDTLILAVSLAPALSEAVSRPEPSLTASEER